MTNLFENICKRFFGSSPTFLQMSVTGSNGMEPEKELCREKYIKWINRRFLYLRFSLISEININNKPNRIVLSHWVPFLCDQNAISKSEQFLHTWSESQKSTNIKLLSNDPFTIHRNPVANSTDSIRGKVGYSQGIHIWKVKWPELMRGTHAVIGVATEQAMLHYDGYVSLVGHDDQSWGWDLVNRKRVHDKISGNPINNQRYPDMNKLRFKNVLSKNKNIPETIYVILDMFQGTLSFAISNVYLGVAHTGLFGKTVYPTISAVWGHCEISLNYFNYITKEIPTLKSLCIYQAKRLLQFHCRYHEYIGKQYRNLPILDIYPEPKYLETLLSLHIPEILKSYLSQFASTTLKF